MLTKQIVILITGEDHWILQTKQIWFWESKTKHLKIKIGEFLSNYKGEEINNIQMY